MDMSRHALLSTELRIALTDELTTLLHRMLSANNSSSTSDCVVSCMGISSVEEVEVHYTWPLSVIFAADCMHKELEIRRVLLRLHSLKARLLSLWTRFTRDSDYFTKDSSSSNGDRGGRGRRSDHRQDDVDGTALLKREWREASAALQLLLRAVDTALSLLMTALHDGL